MYFYLFGLLESYTQVWWCNQGDLVLLGSAEPLRYDLATARAQVAANPGLARDLGPILACRSADELFARFLCTGDELRPLVADAEVLHDRLPRLEAWAARARYERRQGELLGALQRVLAERPSAWPPRVEPTPNHDGALWRARLRHHVHDDLRSARVALERAPDGPEVRALGARLAPDPVAALRAAHAAYPDDAFVQSELGLALAEAGDAAAGYHLLAPLQRETSRHALAMALVEATPDAATRWALRGLDWARSRADRSAIRERLLDILALCASEVPTVVDELARRWEAGRREDLALGLALAAAQLGRGRHADCLDTLAWLADEHAAGHALPLRQLRLEAVHQSGSPYLADELEAFLSDYPREATAPAVQRAMRSLNR